jgi:hypothetical protein
MILSAECNREKRVKKYGEIVEIIINTYNREDKYAGSNNRRVEWNDC